MVNFYKHESINFKTFCAPQNNKQLIYGICAEMLKYTKLVVFHATIETKKNIKKSCVIFPQKCRGSDLEPLGSYGSCSLQQPKYSIGKPTT